LRGKIFAREQRPRHTAQKLLGRNLAEISLSFLNFLEGGAQKKNCKGKFLRGCRRSVSEGGWRGAWNVSQDSAGSKSELFDIMTTRQKIAKALNISLEDLII